MNTIWNGIRNEIKCDSLRATDIYGNIHGPTSNNIPEGITGATGYFGYFNSITGQINNFYSYTGDIDTLYSNTIYAATGEIGTLYSNTIYSTTGDIGTLISDRIYAATGEIGTLYSNTIYSTTGRIDTLNVTDKIVAPTAEIDTLNVTDKIVAPTGEIGTLVSATGRIDTLNVTNMIVAPTGDIGTLVSATGIIDTLNVTNMIVAPTGDIGTLISDRIYAATGIYSASSFTRDQSTDITVPNISSMYQYYAAGPVTIPVPYEGNVFLNRSSLTGMTGTKGTLIPASAFSVGSLFEFYFAGSFTNTGFSNATNLITGSITNLFTPDSTKVYLNDLNNPTTIILCSTTTVFDHYSTEPFAYNNKKLRIQSIYKPDTYQQYNYQILNIERFKPDYYPTIMTYTFTVTYNEQLSSISSNNFYVGEDVIVKFEDSDGPSLNIGLTFEENEAIYDADKAICTINLENTIYYKQKHHFTSKSIFNINDINSNTISISSSNSGSIYCHNGNEGEFISNANTLYKPFNTFDKSYNKTVPFTKNPSNSNTVYPRISVSSFAQNINLEVNNYYLRRIA